MHACVENTYIRIEMNIMTSITKRVQATMWWDLVNFYVQKNDCILRAEIAIMHT